MAALIPAGSASGTGTVTLTIPNTNNTQTATLPDATGTVMISGNMPAFSAYASTGTAISASTWTKITLDTKSFDTNNNFSSSRFTPTVAGYYQISAAINLSSSAIQTYWISIYKNGSVWQYGTLYTTSLGVGGVNNMSSLVYLNGSTDYIELYGYSSTAQTLGTGFPFTYMNGILVRTA